MMLTNLFSHPHTENESDPHTYACTHTSQRVVTLIGPVEPFSRDQDVKSSHQEMFQRGNQAA